MKRVLVLLAVVLVLGSWGLIKKQSNNSNNSKIGRASCRERV